MPLLVNEIFFSIQGESLSMGRPCVFIRLTGCNLRCTYCDTTYAYHEGDPSTIQQLIDAVRQYDCNLVEITGGEPLLQNETPGLVESLLSAGYEVMMETNGSLDISVVKSGVTRIVDMKCPSSGESAANRLENLSQLRGRDQLKFVIKNADDYDFARKMLENLPPDFSHDHVLFSPVAGALSLDTLSGWILRDRLSVRLHFQLHKMIWPKADRGR